MTTAFAREHHAYTPEPAQARGSETPRGRLAQEQPTMPQDDREPLVLLVHRIPYPPNKGDKIRSYHLLYFLSERYRVHLGTFADDPADLAHAEELRKWCEDIYVERLSPLASRGRMLPAMLIGRPL
jgi:hypothetical protein